MSQTQIFRRFEGRLLMLGILILALSLFSACSSSSDSDDEGEMDGMSEIEHEEGDEHEEVKRVANEGATIKVVSPQAGVSFSENEDIVVEVEVEDFALGEDGKHWHVYVDDTSWAMVMGDNLKTVLRGIEPGEHHVDIYLTRGDHVELEKGASIMLMVE